MASGSIVENAIRRELFILDIIWIVTVFSITLHTFTYKPMLERAVFFSCHVWFDIDPCTPV